MNMQPIAQSLASQGRRGDTMLVHMTPNEVGGLQSLAQTMGGSLTTNPTTGLPEANFLEAILPTVLGLGLSFVPGVGPLAAGALVGGGTALATGDLGKGLMAGLGAYGGAGLGGALTAAGTGAASQVGQMAAMDTAMAGGNAAAQQAAQQSVTAGAAGQLAGGAATPAMSFGDKLSAFGTGLSNAASAPGAFLSGNLGNLGAAAAPALTAGMSQQPEFATPASQPSNYEGPYRPTERQVSYPTQPRTSTSEYQYFSPSNPSPGFQPFADGGEVDYGVRAAAPVAEPVQSAPRISPQDAYAQWVLGRMGLADEAGAPAPTSAAPVGTVNVPMPEQAYAMRGLASPAMATRRPMGQTDRMQMPQAQGGFQPFAQGGLAALAAGGELLQDGSFVVDARTVAELGNGSSNAGMELLMQLGGRPVQGPGDGVSDSVPATIEGEQAAAVARDEVIFDPESVARIGGGDPERGAQRLYSLMRKAEQARKEVDRGEDSGVANGLGALAPMEA